jgi:hypothetical protein
MRHCTPEQHRAYYLAHREEILKRTRAYAHDHPEKTATNARKRYHADPEKARLVKKVQRERNPEINRKAVRKWQAENPEKLKAAAQARYSVPLVPVCEVCGEPSTERHHEDYTHPLDVKFLCTQCHRDAHRRKVA